ncbi:hypothetical protein [Kitasatospora sp. NPDC088548]|uniref:hypothetical protein n=1 Tax=Kitasatospora sp. NPDC088548 TaxID=3364075 RepID=UPI00381884A8
MSVAHDRQPELPDLIGRLNAGQAEEIRRHTLRPTGEGETPPRPRLSFTGTGVSANLNLAAEAKRIIRTELRGA